MVGSGSLFLSFRKSCFLQYMEVVLSSRSCPKAVLGKAIRALTRRRGDSTLRIGNPGPVGRILILGEPGNDIVPELRPAEGKLVIDKPGKGSFYATALQECLKSRRLKSGQCLRKDWPGFC